ncbi:MAG TPA: hypothetical protein VK629_01765, partial [Steroidobacteraceae bacterium]|nr:hypothetical protein [Steroidobacteraceae bacterium]
MTVLSTPNSMANRGHHVFITAAGGQRYLLALLTAIAVAFALQQAGLGLFDYLPGVMARLFQAVFILSTATLALLGAVYITRTPAFHQRITVYLGLLYLTYGAFAVAFGGLRPLFYLESIVFALALVPVLADSRLSIGISRVWFWVCACLVALNSVTLMYWAGWIDLEPTFIPRLIETGEDLSDLDAFSFGIFGRTESLPDVGMFFGRLQGWALEPLHWGYFVLLAVASALLVCSQSRRQQERFAIYCMLPLMLAHLMFVSSSSVVLTLGGWFLSLAMLGCTRRLAWGRRHETGLLFFALVIGVGVIVPFSLMFIPDIQLLLVADQALGEGENWADKLEFLSLGPQLFVRFMPLAGDDFQTSHNLVLGVYVKYGYFLVVPLLAFLYWFIKRAISGLPIVLAAGSLLIMLTHLLLVPPAAFYPSGALFFALALITADQHRRCDTSLRG